MIVLIVAAVAIAGLLVAMWFVDRRDRATGHTVSGARGLRLRTREGRRDARAIEQQFKLAPGRLPDRSWTDHERRNRGEAGRYDEPGPGEDL